MISVSKHGVVYENGAFRPAAEADKAAGKAKTMAYGILTSHNTSGNTDALRLKVDAMASPTTSPMWASSRPPGPPA